MSLKTNIHSACHEYSQLPCKYIHYKIRKIQYIYQSLASNTQKYILSILQAQHYDSDTFHTNKSTHTISIIITQQY